MGCLIASILVTGGSIITAHMLFGYFLRLPDILRVCAASAMMALVLDLLPRATNRWELIGTIMIGALALVGAMAASYPRLCIKTLGRQMTSIRGALEKRG